MTTRTCSGCGAHISASSLRACPKCGAGLDDEARTPVPPTPTYSPAVTNAVAIFVVAVMVFIAYMFLTREKPIDGKQQALFLCRKAVGLVSKDPDAANVPYVEPVITKDEFRFTWGHDTRHMRLRNGLGLEVAVTGKCYVSRSTGGVTALAVDGQEFPVQ